MMLIHHLGMSQSERIVWLCEELGLPYDLKHYTRDAKTRLAPPELKAMHPSGAAPLFEDGDVFLAESGAIMDYIMGTYGDGGLKPAPGTPEFAPYLYWFHFANGTLQPMMGRMMILGRVSVASDHPMLAATSARLDSALGLVELRLEETPYLAGAALTAADIMTVFTLSTMRNFNPVDLSPYPNIRAYLARIGERPAYQRAMAKGDPGMELKLT